MASSPTRQRPLHSIPLPPVARRSTTATTALVADVVSFGYVLAAVVATVAFDIQFSVVQVLMIVALFGGLRFVAHEIRGEADRSRVADARRLAALRAQSPKRWSVEQRDGIGRRVDTGA